MTNRELLMMLDGDLGERAIENVMEYGYGALYLNIDSGFSISECIGYGFTWEDTEEGKDFWSKLDDELKSIGL